MREQLDFNESMTFNIRDFEPTPFASIYIQLTPLRPCLSQELPMAKVS